ncbi:hypothetical protein VIBRN418_01937 [Vibrio sp. N418]|nr:hypothetical protein VIBRN418_01937 [Vibrio sp. N418]
MDAHNKLFDMSDFVTKVVTLSRPIASQDWQDD